MDQKDVDSLINDGSDAPQESASAAGGAPAGAPAPEDAGAGDSGFSAENGFSQADIDALMTGAQPGSESECKPAEASAPPADQGAAALDSLGKPMDEFAAAMAAAIAEEQAGAAHGDAPAADLPLEEVPLPTFDEGELISEVTQPVSLLHDVQLHVKIELGRTHMFVEDVLRLGEGSVVELDRLAGDPVDVYVNGRLVARGEVLVLNDNFCVRISEIVSTSAAKMVG